MDFGFDGDLQFLRESSVLETAELGTGEQVSTVNPGLLLLPGSEPGQRSLTPPSPTFGSVFPLSSPTRHIFDDLPDMDVNGTTATTTAALEIGVNPSFVLRPVVLIPPSRFKPLSYASSRSGVVYDVRMRYHTDPRPDAFDPHPEMPKRISEIFEELRAAGLIEDPLKPDDEDAFKMIRIPIRQADPSEIALVHSVDHVQFVQNLRGEHCFEIGFDCSDLTCYRLLERGTGRARHQL